MDLISREAVANELEKNMYSEDFCSEHMIDYSINMGMAKITVASMPSAFEGKTNGEVLTAIFPNFTFQKAWDEASAKHCMIMWTGENLICDIPLDFWDSPYKGVSE